MTARSPAEVRHDAVLGFAHQLVNAALVCELHGGDAQLVHRTLADLVQALQAAAAAGVEMPLCLQLDDDRLYFDGEPLAGPSLQARSLLAHCRERQVAALAFLPTLTADEARRCFDLLLLPQNREALARQHRERALCAMGIKSMRVQSRIAADPGNRKGSVQPEADEALHRYQDLADHLQKSHARALRDQQLGVDEVHGAVERTLRQMSAEPSSLLALAAQDNIDRFTVGHSVRVALLALQVARAAGADHDQLVGVGTAALLHDIGKSKVPPEVLFKQGRLDDAEWAEMARHPRLGAQILMEQPHLDPRCIGAAFCHHMRPDGDGYPNAVLPVPPSGISRLVRVCDVFEALTAVRPYKRALTPVEAYAVMFRATGDFDQRWLQLFAHTLGLFPLGTRLLLDDGAHAVVIRQGEAPTRPFVRLLTGPAGSDLEADAPDLLQVGVPLDGVTVQVAAVLTHDRTVPLPQFDDDPAILTQTTHHACLSDGRTLPAP